MGNQNTSGILEEEKSRNEAQENVGSIDDLNKVQNGTKNIGEDEKSDCHDVEDDKIGHVENQEFGEKVSTDISSKHDEPEELNLKLEISNSNDEVHGETCTSQGDVQRSDHSNLIPASGSDIENSNPIPHEAIKITSQPQEDQKMLVEETMKTLGSVNSCLIEAEFCPIDTKIAQNAEINVVLNSNDCDLAKNGIENDIMNKEEDQKMLVEETMKTLGSVEACIIEAEIRSVDTKIAQNAKINVVLGFGDCELAENGIEIDTRSEDSSHETLMMNGVGLEDKTSGVNQTMPMDQEIDSFSGLEKVAFVDEAKANDEGNQIDEIKDTNEVHAMVNEVDLLQTEDDKSTVEIHAISGFEKINFVEGNEERSQIDHEQHLKDINEVYETANENRLSQTEPNTKDDNSINEIHPFSGLEAFGFVHNDFQNDEKNQIEPKQVNDANETVKETGLSESEVAQIPETLYSKTESSKFGDLNFKRDEDSKKRVIELKKSPSFEFGVPFDPMSEESDKTPFLYHDKIIPRSFSSSSTLRLKDQKVQNEYFRKSLQNEGVEVEEKTIRMERSNSEALKSSSLNVLKNDEKSDFVIKTTRENGLNDSIENCDINSPKENGKRKPKSSLFTTCICCTAAIS